jgi:hypothetical protein
MPEWGHSQLIALFHIISRGPPGRGEGGGQRRPLSPARENVPAPLPPTLACRRPGVAVRGQGEGGPPPPLIPFTLSQTDNLLTDFLFC